MTLSTVVGSVVASSSKIRWRIKSRPVERGNVRGKQVQCISSSTFPDSRAERDRHGTKWYDGPNAGTAGDEMLHLIRGRRTDPQSNFFHPSWCHSGRTCSAPEPFHLRLEAKAGGAPWGVRRSQDTLLCIAVLSDVCQWGGAFAVIMVEVNVNEDFWEKVANEEVLELPKQKQKNEKRETLFAGDSKLGVFISVKDSELRGSDNKIYRQTRFLLRGSMLLLPLLLWTVLTFKFPFKSITCTEVFCFFIS